MKQLFKILMCLAILLLAFAECKKPVEDEKPKPPTPGTEMQKVVLQGKVLDISGKPLNGVRVTSGTSVATTKENGVFLFTEAQVVNKRAIIKFEKNGYFTLTRSGVKENEMFIIAVLHEKKNTDISVSTTFNSSEATTLKVNSGMKVNLKASSITRADGSAYSGTVKADMLYLAPSDDNFFNMMPGSDLIAQNNDGKEVMLVSWGMIDVNLTDNSGNPLQIKDGEKAETVFPIPAGMKNNPPASIPLWYFDEGKGIWIEQGVATLKDGVYVGEVSHFSWHNLDEPEEYATITGKVVDCEDNPIPYIQVFATGGNGGGTGITNAQGVYSIKVPKDTPVTLSVSRWNKTVTQNVPGLPGGSVYNASPLELPCGVIIKGKVVCENNGKPIAYADLTAKGGSESSTAYTTLQGEFTMHVPPDTPVTITVSANGGSDSESVPGQPERTVYITRNLKVPCPNDPPDGGDDPGTWVPHKELSLKYAMYSEGSVNGVVCYTCADNGWKFRYDTMEDAVSQKSRSTFIINHFNKTMWMGDNYDEEEEWTDGPYSEDYAPFTAFCIDESTLQPYLQGTTVFLGKTCKIYNISYQGTTVIYTIWNGVMMACEMNGELVMKALAVSLSVPNKAFTKTFVVDWL
jgi:hypothetical protein